MKIVHDLYCRDCGYEVKGVAVEGGTEMPDCPADGCGAELRVDWSHGQAPRVDAHEERYCESIDRTYTSRRDLETKAAERGWYPAGDKIGGARNETFDRGHKAFGYQGQRSRASTAERGGKSQLTDRSP